MRNAPLEHRLSLLERRITRLRAALIGCVGVAILSIGVAMAPPNEEKLTLRRLTVVDSKGTPRIVIGEDEPGLGRISPSTGITIHDATGAERFGVGVMEDNRINMGFDAPVGAGHAMRDRISLSVSPSGAARIALIDNHTAMPVRLVTDSTGGGGIEFLDYDKPNSKVIVKRLSIDGETRSEVQHTFPPDSTAGERKK